MQSFRPLAVALLAISLVLTPTPSAARPPTILSVANGAGLTQLVAAVQAIGGKW